MQVETSKRNSAIDEIVDSERRYVSGLQRLHTHFIIPLLNSINDADPYIDQETFDFCFKPLIMIKEFNEQLLKRMCNIQRFADTLTTENWTSIPQLFSKTAKMMKIYAEYIKNYDDIVTRLRSLRQQRPTFKKFMQMTEQTMWDKDDQTCFASYLIAPVQRIPRYILLLNNLLDCTEKTHQEYNEICYAVRSLQEVATFMNEQIRENHRLRPLCKLVSTIGNLKEMGVSLVDKNRQLVHEGKLVESIGETNKLRHVYLCNDILVICNKNNNYRSHFEWKKVPKAWIRTGTTDTSFVIVTLERVYLFRAASREECITWLKCIRKVLKPFEEIKTTTADVQASGQAELLQSSHTAADTIAVVTQQFKKHGVTFVAGDIVFVKIQNQKPKKRRSFVGKLMSRVAETLSSLSADTMSLKAPPVEPILTTSQYFLVYHVDVKQRKLDPKTKLPILCQADPSYFTELSECEILRCPLSCVLQRQLSDAMISPRSSSNSRTLSPETPRLVDHVKKQQEQTLRYLTESMGSLCSNPSLLVKALDQVERDDYNEEGSL